MDGLHGKKIKIMAVYGGIQASRIISEALSSIGEVELVATALSAKMAEARLNRISVDLLLFDVEDVDEENLAALKRIRRTNPDMAVIILSGVSSSSADKTIEALEMGAMDFITKPAGDEASFRCFNRELSIALGMYRNRLNFKGTPLECAKKVSEWNSLPFSPETRQESIRAEKTTDRHDIMQHSRPGSVLHRFEAVCIGISAGGPNALVKVMPELPADFPVPVFVVQHMPVLFTSSLAASLDKRSHIHVTEARDRMPAKPGTVYLAPGGKHMAVKQEKVSGRGEVRIVLNDDPPENSCRPSVNHLFRSVAEVYGKHSLAIIMTGMGNDGLLGVEIIKSKGGYCLSQTGDTCVVYGMPRVVDEAGLSDEKVPLDQIAARISALVGIRLREWEP